MSGPSTPNIDDLRKQIAELEERQRTTKGDYAGQLADLRAQLERLIAAQAYVESPAQSPNVAQTNADASQFKRTETVAAPEPPAPLPVFLTRRGNTRLSIAFTDAPWQLPVEAFVLPMTPRFEMGGGLHQAWLKYLGPQLTEAYIRLINEAREASRRSYLDAAQPLLVHLPDTITSQRPAPRTLILATSRITPDAPPEVNATRIAAGAVVRLATQHRLRRVAIALVGSGSAGLKSAEVAPAMLRGVIEALPNSTLSEVILTTFDQDAVTAAQAMLQQRIQGLDNDLARGDDLLNIEGEVAALAEGLLLRELEPPLVVGVLGGWGSGKSFVMHLLHQRLSEIRGLARPQTATPESFPYVGHVYLIRFDAWTYAKSNLWASLMQTIFNELNRQLTLEQKLMEANVSPFDGGRVWQVLYELSPERQRALLQDELSGDLFKSLFDESQQGEVTEDLLWAKLKELKKVEREALQETEAALAKKREALERARRTLEQNVDAEIEKEARREAWQPLQGALNALSADALATVKTRLEATGQAGEGELPQVHEIALTPGGVVALIQKNPWEALAFGLFFLTSLLGPLLLQQLETYQFPGAVLAFGSAVLAAMRAVERWRRALAESFAAYRKQVDEGREKLKASREQRLNQKLEQATAEVQAAKDDETQLAALTSVPALELAVQKLEAQAKRQRQRVGLTADSVSLVDFINSRLDEAFYENQLGLMHQVQRDLAEVSEGLTRESEGQARDEAEKVRQELFPRGPARIVLFIDDLDRCPPDKVVEVLEATQLLIKTPLFVVVLAMDVRFITRALEKTYSGILTRKGRPSGLDYIEKIIQIPYQVRPIEAGALPRYLSSLMRAATEPTSPPADGSGAPGGSPTPGGVSVPVSVPTPIAAPRGPMGVLPTKALTFSAKERDWVERCCTHIDLTPRAIKRLVNVYKLIKIIWARPNPILHPAWEVEQTIVVLLALAGRYPAQMRETLEALKSKIEHNAPQTFVQFFETYEPLEASVFEEREWELLLGDVQALLPPLTVGLMDLANFDLVRSFSFVGDIGYEPGDFPLEAQLPHTPASAEPPAPKKPRTRKVEKNDK
jgi:O-acetyl-ADP-ribose deacetylase (regulator of RNase III)